MTGYGRESEGGVRGKQRFAVQMERITMELNQIGFCGVDCSACPDLQNGICPGCRESVWPEGDACPPVVCCGERRIPCCGLCQEFPCSMMKEFYGESESHEQAYRRMRSLREEG
jgi:hypothetical protein